MKNAENASMGLLIVLVLILLFLVWRNKTPAPAATGAAVTGDATGGTGAAGDGAGGTGGGIAGEGLSAIMALADRNPTGTLDQQNHTVNT